MLSVTLRPLTDDDVPPLAGILREPSVRARWREWDEERVRQQLVHPAPDERLTVWGIVVDGELAGAVQLGEGDDPEYRHAGIDLFLSRAWQGRGVGPQAIARVVEVAFVERGHHRLVIDPAADNESAIRAYARVGFSTVGRMRAYELDDGGGFHDGLLMERLREDARLSMTDLEGARLRRANPDDERAIGAMSEALYREDPGARSVTRADVTRTLAHFREHPERGVALVFENDDALVGYAFVCAFWSNEYGGLIAIVDELYLVPRARGRGLATRFFDALAKGRVVGFEHLVALDLEVTAANERARALYQRLGFRPAKNGMLRRVVVEAG